MILLPFVPSSDARFEAEVVTPHTQRTAEDNLSGTTAHVDAFEAYQARADIESRTSILNREQAQPGSIQWADQTNKHEVDVVNTGTA